jgi:dipeptidase
LNFGNEQNYLGSIRETNTTFNVIGNLNEYGLCIGESTFGGIDILSDQDGAILDYGSLIYVTLQRAKTARQAIQIMVTLMDEYGYASEGESFSIADHSGEVWIMEVIGRGTSYGKKGAVWVAQRVPSGYVTAHANQARIQTFPRNDPENCLFSHDVVDVAVFYGLFSPDKDPDEFSFSDVYCPISFQSARLSEARVWSIFSTISDNSGMFQRKYLDYATGRNISNRMPLWVKPNKLLSLLDVMSLMNSHYEGSELDASLDVGSGLYSSPYRPRPLEWSFQGNEYHNERPIGVQQTGWNFVAQIRPYYPNILSAINWFAADDSSTSPRVPIYASSRIVSEAYYGHGAQDGVLVPLLEFNITKAFWVQNMVSNLAYSRWSDIYPVLRTKIDKIQKDFVSQIRVVDELAFKIYQREGSKASIDYVTDYSVKAADNLHVTWLKFYGELFARFRDFLQIIECHSCSQRFEVKETGLTEEWKTRIIQDTGDHYAIHTRNIRNEEHNHQKLVKANVRNYKA